MVIKLKEINLAEENYNDIINFKNTIDLYIKRYNDLKSAISIDDNKEYFKTITKLFNIAINKEDIKNYLKYKNGIMYTNISTNYNGINELLSYDILYLELDLEHIYSKDEINSLIKSGKIILLDSKAYTISDNNLVNESNSFKTISEYDFNNLDNNYDYYNEIMIDYINNVFSKDKLKETINEYKTNLLFMLNEYKENALIMRNYSNYSTLYNSIINCCDDNINTITK